MHDWQLLNEYVEQDSQEAFATLVTRYINLVYSVCLREVHDADLAQDVTQVVFLLLAKKATTLRKDPTLRAGRDLVGWLYQTARFSCKDALKLERRRQRNQQKASEEIMHQAHIENRESAWDEVEPVLHAALDSLSRDEREIVLMRFFQKKSLLETGASLGISEDAARKRVARALDKMRQFFQKRGFVMSAVALSALIGTHAVQAAPAVCVSSALGAGSLFSAGMAIPVTGSGASGLASSLTPGLGKIAVPTIFKSVNRNLLLGQVKMVVAAAVATSTVGVGAHGLYRARQHPAQSVVQPVPVVLPASRPAAMPPFPAMSAYRSAKSAPKIAHPTRGGKRHRLVGRMQVTKAHTALRKSGTSARVITRLALPQRRPVAALPVVTLPPRATPPLPVKWDKHAPVNLQASTGSPDHVEAAPPVAELAASSTSETGNRGNREATHDRDERAPGSEPVNNGVRDHGQGHGRAKGLGRGTGQIRGRGRPLEHSQELESSS